LLGSGTDKAEDFAMRRLLKFSLLTLFCLSANLAGAKADEQSQVIKLEEAPAAVQKTIHEQSEGKGRIGDIERTTEDGETNYDVELIKNRSKRNFRVAPDGKLASWQVFMRELPEPARKTIREQSAKGELMQVDRVLEDGKVNFEATMKLNGRESTFTVSQDGKLIAVELQWAETPAKVQAGIQKQAAGAVIKSIEKNTEDEDGDISYDVEVLKDGKKISFSMDAEGNLEEE
jgi:uncharacterized membrane protein YkoI